MTFSLDSFRITDTRSRHNDTDYVSCTLLVRETRLTLAGLREEAHFTRVRFHCRLPGGQKTVPPAAPSGLRPEPEESDEPDEPTDRVNR